MQNITGPQPNKTDVPTTRAAAKVSMPLAPAAGTALAPTPAQPNHAANQIPPPPETLIQALADVKQRLTTVANHLQLTIDRETGQTVVKIVDSQTDELIKQIPARDMVDIARAMHKLKGLLVDQSV